MEADESELDNINDGFRPLLTRIISYLKGKTWDVKEFRQFPSPFNEDHFISTKTIKASNQTT